MRGRRRMRAVAAGFGWCVVGAAPAAGQPDLVNWEHPHVHPIDLTPDGATLVAVNTPDNRLEVFTIQGDGTPVWTASVPVGLDPVSVRVRSNTRAWVVNHVSDSVSIVDLPTGRVVATLRTGDEPADVVFAGSPERAFVSISQENRVMVFDPADLGAPAQVIEIVGEDPRGMAVSEDGSQVFVAIFESGNGTTILGGGLTMGAGAFPPNVVNDGDGPYGGANPPPNDGVAFSPLVAEPDAPGVGLIVRKDGQGQWMDDNGGDWTVKVSGAQAADSGRIVGWDLVDHDVAVIDAGTHSVSYVTGLMNLCMAIGFNGATGEVTVVGTEATNEVRFEPNVAGRFTRVNVALADPANTSRSVVDLNPHLAYVPGPAFTPIAQGERDRSIGDPRAIAWNGSGTRAYVAGMGSNNLVVIDAAGVRAGLADTIEVGQGPTGVVLNEGAGAGEMAYVLNKFDATVSSVDLGSEVEVGVVGFFDPSPTEIRLGRRHLYDTHATSGLGQISCGSCHVDARMDRLAWDLGDPSGAVKAFNQNCISGGCEDWHPMKGPMLTQTLQDIIGKEGFHWRADREGLEAFNPAFVSLLGDDAQLTPGEMQEFEDFLATIHYPPNPHRNFDNTLPTSLPLPGHFTTGRFAPAGQPLPDGDAQAGLDAYRLNSLDGVQCVTCHTLPTGAGPDGAFVGFQFQPIPPGPDGERHLGVVSVDGSTNVSIKIPQLRNLYERTGFNTTQQLNTAGFGYLHDGSVDSIERFISEPVFSLGSVQEVADVVAFMLAFSGSDLPAGNPNNVLEPPGPASKDTHAAVGWQTTVVEGASIPAEQDALITSMLSLADADAVGLVVKGVQGGVQRGYAYAGGGTFQSDRASETVSAATLRVAAGPGAELTWTVVPRGSEVRIGIDRDRDAHLDRDEVDAGSDPADPSSVPPPGGCAGDLDGDADTDVFDFGVFASNFGSSVSPGTGGDFDGDGDVDVFDFGAFAGDFGCAP